MNQVIKKRIEDINNGIVPEGYKQTPFGIFPCDWEADKNYGDLFEFNGSLSKSREELGEEGYAYLHYGDMHRHSFNTVSYEQYSFLPKVSISLYGKEKCLMRDGDVAFLDASEDLEGTSRCVLIDNPNNAPFFAGLHTIPARETGNNFSKWYKQYITLPDFVKKQFQRLACGFKVYGLNKETIAKIDYAFPKDKTEQGKIAEILMKWDEMVELQEQYIQKLELRKKHIEKELISKKSEKDIDLQELCTITTGKLDANAQVEGGKYPFFTCAKEVFGIDSYAFEGESLLVSGNGAHVGYIHYYNGKFNAYQRTYVLQNCKCNIKFLKCFLEMALPERLIKEKNEGNTPYIVYNTLAKMKIWIPSSIKQERISTILCKVDEEISLQKEKLDRIKIQRKAMQQYLLTGIVRVS